LAVAQEPLGTLQQVMPTPTSDAVLQAWISKQMLVLLLQVLLPNRSFRPVDHPACVGMHTPLLASVKVVTYQRRFDNVYRI
jgi:hypothetical protein